MAHFWGRVTGCDFDYFSRVDIVSGADAQARRKIIYGIVIIAMLLLYGRERIEQRNGEGQTHEGGRW